MTTHVLVPTNEYAVAKERSARLIQALAAGCWVLSYTWLDACLELGRRVPEHTYEVKGCRTKGGSGRVQDIRPRRREKGEPGLFAGTLIFVPGWSQKDAKALGRRDLAIQVAKLAGGEVIEEVTSAEQRMQCVTVAESALKAEGFHFRGFSKAVEFSWVTESLLAGRLLPFPRYGDADD